MNKAFVKEDDEERYDDLPDRPVSPHPNLVTPEGLAQIEAKLARLHEEHAAAQAEGDRAALAATTRELRYWTSRRATAQLVPPPQNPNEVEFGCKVTIEREGGRRQTWRIVGEDEAEPAEGKISYASPVARALMGRKVGDVVMAGTSEAEIVAIE